MLEVTELSYLRKKAGGTVWKKKGVHFPDAKKAREERNQIRGVGQIKKHI